MHDILIKNADIITMDKHQPIVQNGVIGISDGKIAFVGDRMPIGVCMSSFKRVIDGSGKIVMPGLINAHAHTAMCLLRGYADDYPLNEWLFERILPAEAMLDEEMVRAGAYLGIAEMLASGTTSFSDMYFFQPATAKIVEETGIKASLCNAVVALDDDYVFESDRAVKETLQLVHEYHGAANGRIRADAAIHAEYTSLPKVWHKVSELALRYGLITHLHLSETKAEHEGCIHRYGKTPAEVFFESGVFANRTLAAHGVWLTDSDMQLLSENGVSVAHNPTSNLKLASGIANVRKMLQSGINVCLGTDGCASNNTLDMLEEAKLCALLAKGASFDACALNAMDTLKIATVNGAYAQGRELETGALIEGLDADIIMLDTNNPHMRPSFDIAGSVVYTARGGDVCLTMVQGKILYENGCFTTIDIEKAVAQSGCLASKLTAKLK